VAWPAITRVWGARVLLIASGLLLAACGVPARGGLQFSLRPAPDTGRVLVPGSSLFFERAGSGPPVILLHGGNLDRRMWDAEFAELQRTHLVVRYDARGYGRSGPADTAFSAHDDLLALMDALRLTRVSLVGLSLGGRIAIDFTLAHPERIDRLVLAAPGISGGTWADDGDTAWVAEARRAAASRGSVAVTRAWLGSAYIRTALRDSATAARVRGWVADQSRFWGGIVRHGDLERAVEPPAADRLAELRAPILLLVGTDDTAFIHDVAGAIAARARNVRRVNVPGVGHMVNLEAPAIFRAAVLEFLSR
jgi:3-oxoadipate enol-lactonase